MQRCLGCMGSIRGCAEVVWGVGVSLTTCTLTKKNFVPPHYRCGLGEGRWRSSEGGVVKGDDGCVT